MKNSLFDRVENTVGKGENAGNQHFLLFPQCFPKPSFLGSSKFAGLCGIESNSVNIKHCSKQQAFTNIQFEKKKLQTIK